MTWAAISRSRTLVGACFTAALAAAVLALALVPADAGARFQVGLSSLGQAQASAAMNAIDGSVVRQNVAWAAVAPKTVPAGFQPANPSDPRYDWRAVDAALRTDAQRHLQVILTFLDAPTWAQGPGPIKPYVSPGAWDPNPTMFAAFVQAAAVRYGGSFPDPLHRGATLPRVTYWEPWNEPNIPGYLSAPNTVGAYRTLSNEAYGVLKAVHGDNLVVLGGLAPVSPEPDAIPALDFAAKLLCLHRAGAGFRTNRTCRQRPHFAALDIHPYSLAATPTKPAYKRGDVLVGDVGKVGALARAARLRRLWATEFSWISNPPNPQLGDSEPTAARYVAYSMYEMWKAGVSLVIWELVSDVPGADMGGSGLYSSSGQPKLTLQAFAFPVVASVGGGRGLVWGRAPVSQRVRVVVQHLVRQRWRTVTRLRTGSDGVFIAHFRAGRNGVYRAYVVGGPTSLPYDSRPIPPRRTHAFTIP